MCHHPCWRSQLQGRHSGGDPPSQLAPHSLGEAGGCSWLPLPPPLMAMAMSPAGADPEETILNAFKVFDPEGKGLKSA